MEHENESNYMKEIDLSIKRAAYPIKKFLRTQNKYLRGVHCDEISTGWIEFDVFALKHKPKVLAVFGLFDHQDLLGNHRQDLQVNPVELIKAAPASRLSQSGEELP